jgi:hypothetical protein
MKKTLLILMVVAIYVLHQDWWNWHKTEPLVLGVLPIGLAYHAAYSVLAAIMMSILVKFAWPEHLDSVEPQRDDPELPGEGGES